MKWRKQIIFIILTFLLSKSIVAQHSVAREWNEVLLQAIREDYARPTVHARNLFHTSIAMYDVWALFNPPAKPYLINNTIDKYVYPKLDISKIQYQDKQKAIEEVISYAVYKILWHRFISSPHAVTSLMRFDSLMTTLGYDINYESQDYSKGSLAALGNFIGQCIIDYGKNDGANEANGYKNRYYKPINPPLNPTFSCNPDIMYLDHWQSLKLELFIDQSGNVIPDGVSECLTPEWGNVVPFALNKDSLVKHVRGKDTFNLYFDPGIPPSIEDDNTIDFYKWNFELVAIWASHLTPHDNVIWDISPNGIGNVQLPTDFSFEELNKFYNLLDGGDTRTGHHINPYTNTIYEEQLVPRGDYTRVLAEFWADGPDSETPPGHWFTMLNYINDHPKMIKKFKGKGDVLDNLEWDVKAYFALGGAVHDAAITAWSIKGWYDYIRPISAIRLMADFGQCSDSTLPSYHPKGIHLYKNLIELVDSNDVLAGKAYENVGKIKLFTWRGHDYIDSTAIDEAGVGWILAENWWPYQKPTFVTPPFQGYISGHSTYSRAAAELLTLFTGNEYFPGGMSEFVAEKNKFLQFEEGPSTNVVLQWATYRDASDQCSLSRIWGGIHPPIDDIPGRILGKKVGINAFHMAEQYFNKTP